MNPSDPVQQVLQHLTPRLTELGAWRDRHVLPLRGTFHAGEQTFPISEGDPWPARALPVTMRFTVRVPGEWRGLPVHVRLQPGGEALLRVNGEAVGGLNPYHLEHPLLASAEGGEELNLELEVVPRGLFGTPLRENALRTARLIVPDEDVRAVLHDFGAAQDAAGQLQRLGRGDVAALVADALRDALALASLDRADTAAYLSRLAHGPLAERLEQLGQTPTSAGTLAELALMPSAGQALASLWEEYAFSPPGGAFPDAARPSLAAAREALSAALHLIRDRYPAEGRLWLTGHAHIDLAWLWPLEETRRKARRTFATVLNLMDRYPDFYFNQSSAQLYAWVEKDDPALFERVRARVREGRWDVVGGMWVEPDGNLISGEAWARQLLYGQRYFEGRFGKRARVGWLPDTFGYTANLPQFLRQADIPSFFTTKLNWNETNAFPYDLYRWEALDGSRVLAHSFLNPNQGYNGQIVALDLLETWRNFRGKRAHDTSLLAFGYGDGGGGPTEEMLEREARLRDFPGLPRLVTGRVEDFYAEVKQEGLPVWIGEQYLELHRGTYTTQGLVKFLNRRAEHALVEADAAVALARRLAGTEAPGDELHEAWTTLLRNQFHDILPGSGIHTVNAEAREELTSALETARRLRDTALEALSARVRRDGEAVVVWNLSGVDRPLHARIEWPQDRPASFVTPGGTEVATHREGGTLYLHAPDHPVPGLGYTTLLLREFEPWSPPPVDPDDLVLENARLRVEVAEDGTLASVYDKTLGREALGGRGNQLWAHEDLPRLWDAWDVDAHDLTRGQEVTASERPTRTESGPRQSIRVLRRVGNAEIEQLYHLDTGRPRLEIETRLRWTGRRTMLRARFPLNVRALHATYETAFGVVTRPTHRNTSWEAAQFEVPAHRWADLSEGDFGVSLLNDGKYGHGAEPGALSLTLLRSPIYPDPHADEGEQHFTYALYPHPGDWRNGATDEAADLNAPLVAMYSERPEPDGALDLQARLVTVQPGGLRLAALKEAEDGNALVVRVYDALGTRGTASVALHSVLGGGDWERVNFLEEPAPDPGDLRFGPFTVVTLRRREGDGGDG
ncbi:alpha-mannosidase (plasmid) [Deinococcus aetherius]|uniref:Alpha-mannosidase n=1 Tax=Deinococcus aetherius TaxID=200252 RepID=A0ABM8AKW1_9DEIO|nr:glycoside hydrolase family 38 C-terminal domain-containing protein [Deinococcus aetherius]BDP44481.1 alpha-mannosidase [Deinococcus aetherius]